MSKYYKAEDVIRAIEDKIAEYIPYLYGRYYELPLEIRMAIEHLPTIDIVNCEECRWQDDCSQVVENIEGTAMTLLRWCSDGVRKDNE